MPLVRPSTPSGRSLPKFGQTSATSGRIRPTLPEIWPTPRDVGGLAEAGCCRDNSVTRKFRKSCPPHIPESYTRRTRRAPELFNSWPQVGDSAARAPPLWRRREPAASSGSCDRAGCDMESDGRLLRCARFRRNASLSVYFVREVGGGNLPPSDHKSIAPYIEAKVLRCRIGACYLVEDASGRQRGHEKRASQKRRAARLDEPSIGGNLDDLIRRRQCRCSYALGRDPMQGRR